MCGTLIVWIFVMRILMILTSLVAYFINEKISAAKYVDSKDFDAEKPLTNLVWITSLISIGVTFAASYVLLPPTEHGSLWWYWAHLCQFASIGEVHSGSQLLRRFGCSTTNTC
jgi:K(+)-stimulated pyrophosphate-energized sodium pump